MPGTGVLGGAELAGLLADPAMTALLARWVPQSPLHALEMARERFGIDPGPDGHGVPAIRSLRQAVQECATDPAVPFALVIVAVHTHWDRGLPVILRAGPDGYLVGPLKPEAGGRYQPIAFALTPDGPLAYEWAEAALTTEDEAACDLAVGTIGRVASALGGTTWPYGLALNIRFRRLFGEAAVPNVELPLDEPGAAEDSETARILPLSALTARDLAAHGPVERVGWHAVSERCHGLGPAGQQILAGLRAIRDAED